MTRNAKDKCLIRKDTQLEELFKECNKSRYRAVTIRDASVVLGNSNLCICQYDSNITGHNLRHRNINLNYSYYLLYFI